MLPEQVLVEGYWRYLGWPADFLVPLRRASEYQGQDILSIAYASYDDTPSERRQRLAEWRRLLPSLRLRMLRFHAAHQELLEAAGCITTLEALDTGVGRLRSLEPVAGCTALKSLVIQSCPALTGLAAVQRLPGLLELAVVNVREAHDLSLLEPLEQLELLGICGSLWSKQVIDDLWPLTRLTRLQSLSIFSTRILRGGLQPVYQLKNLGALGCDLQFAGEFRALRAALPRLRYGTPIDYPEPMTRAELVARVTRTSRQP